MIIALLTIFWATKTIIVMTTFKMDPIASTLSKALSAFTDWTHAEGNTTMILLLPFLKVLIVITLLFGLWVLWGGSLLFAFLSIIITGVLLIRQQDLI